ncbi:hypothetical protein ACFLQ2_02735 [archaeon]
MKRVVLLLLLLSVGFACMAPVYELDFVPEMISVLKEMPDNTCAETDWAWSSVLEIVKETDEYLLMANAEKTKYIIAQPECVNATYDSQNASNNWALFNCSHADGFSVFDCNTKNPGGYCAPYREDDTVAVDEITAVSGVTREQLVFQTPAYYPEEDVLGQGPIVVMKCGDEYIFTEEYENCGRYWNPLVVGVDEFLRMLRPISFLTALFCGFAIFVLAASRLWNENIKKREPDRQTKLLLKILAVVFMVSLVVFIIAITFF